MGVGLTGPDHFVAPVRRRLRRRRVGFARRLRIANLQLHLSRGVAHRVHDRHVLCARLQRSVNGSVCIDCRIALVRHDLIMAIGLRIGPVPQRHDDVPLLALRPGRRHRRQLASGNPIGPVGEHRQRALPADLGKLGVHPGASLSRLNPPIPSRFRRLERAEGLGNFARRLVAQLMTARAAVGVHDVANPLALALHRRRNPVAPGRWPRAGEVTLGRHLKQREPIQSRVVVRRRLRVRRRNRRQIENLARRRLDFRRVDEPVAANPHVVVCLRKVGDQVAALIVGDHDFDQACGQLPGFRDHPDARLGAARSSDHAADVVIVDGHCSVCDLTCTQASQRSSHEHGDRHHRDSQVQRSSAHVASLGRLPTHHPQIRHLVVIDLTFAGPRYQGLDQKYEEKRTVNRR